MHIVLIVSDPAAQASLGAFLQSVGCEVQTAATGDDGVQCIEQQPPDVVVVQSNLPDRMSGPEVTAWMHTHPTLSHVPAILAVRSFNELRPGTQAAAIIFDPIQREALARALLPFANSDVAARLSEFAKGTT